MELFKAIGEIPLNDKEGEFNREMLLRRWGKRTFSETINELTGVDFVGYGDGESFRHLRDTPPRYFTITFIGSRKKRCNPIIKWRK